MDTTSKLSFMLHEMVCFMDIIADKHLKKHHDISFKKFFVLAVLYSCQPTTQARLAEAMSYSPAAVSRSLAILEKDGYVQVLDDPKHGRSNLVTLTISGTKLVEKSSAELDELFHSIVGDGSINIAQFTNETRKMHSKLMIELKKEK